MSLKSRIGVVVCSITATVYYGGLCTHKYISDPVTVSTEIVPLETLPPLKWSICKPFTLTDCTIPLVIPQYYPQYYSLFYNDYDNLEDTTTNTNVGKYDYIYF